MAEQASTLLVSRDGPIATLRINRPEQGNAVDDPTMDRLIAALEELSTAEGLRIIQVRGEGQDFCAGRHAPPTLRNAPAGAIARNLAKIIRVNALLARQPAVTVAVVRGRALGFGCGLAAQCDLTLAAEDARLAFPEIKGGLPPALGLSWLSPPVAPQEGPGAGDDGARDGCRRSLRPRTGEPGLSAGRAGGRSGTLV